MRVVLEYDERCPRCRALERLVRKVCHDLGVPFIPVKVGGDSVVAHTSTSVEHTFDPEWVRRRGLLEHKLALRRIEPVLKLFRRLGMRPTPNLRIEWFDGARWKTIVVSGFDPYDEEKRKQFLANLYVLLKALKSR